jgi:hypothetical protein
MNEIWVIPRTVLLVIYILGLVGFISVCVRQRWDGTQILSPYTT